MVKTILAEMKKYADEEEKEQNEKPSLRVRSRLKTKRKALIELMFYWMEVLVIMCIMDQKYRKVH